MTLPPSSDSQLFVGGRIFTGRSEDDFASAFRIRGTTFEWVGDEADVSAAERSDAIDLGGRTVVPGFLDVHTHPSFMAELIDAVECLPPDVLSVDALLAALRTHPNLGRGNHLWIEGFGFDESKYPEGRKPTARDLDAVSATQPILLRRCDGHTAVCNSRALELAGITRDTPDPAGGRFERFEDGSPTGVLVETSAMRVVEQLMPVRDARDTANRISRLGEHFLSRGIVAVDDLMATCIESPLETFRAAERAGFELQVGLYYAWTAIADGALDEVTTEHRSGRVKIAGIKVLMDGAYSDRNAWTEDEYPDSCSNHGIRTITDEELRRAVGWARENAVQVAIHAMGDRSLNHVIDMFGEEEPWLETIPSIRLEHATLVDSAMIDRLNAATMTFGIASHTIFLFAEYDSYEKNLSKTQFDIAYPIRSLYERLPVTALSSDNPATAWTDADNVFVSIQAAVLRRAYNGADIGAAEAITVPQAVLLYTARAAQLSPLDGVGLISEGFEGSFAVLDHDVFTIPADEIDSVRVAETWVQGRRAYVRG